MDNPTITIGGQTFPVPQLALGQLKIVVPALLRLNSMRPETLTEENITDLTEIAYIAICRAQPTFKRSDFMAMSGTVEELMLAKVVIAQQCGMTFKTDAEPGEAKAGTSTGITS